METIINNKKMNNIMGNIKNILLIMALFIILPFVTAQETQHNLMEWNFENGAGSIAPDDSGNNNLGILFGNILYSATSKFGSYSTTYDNTNNYIIANIYQYPISNVTSYSLWIYPTGNERDIPLAIYDDNDIMRFGINYDRDSIKGVWYYDNLGNYQSSTLITDVDTVSTWINLILIVDFDNSLMYLYRDGILLGSASISTMQRTNYPYNLIIGTDQYLGNDFSGNIDAVHYYDFGLNSTQITELITNNNVTLFIGGTIEPEINVTTQSTIINSTSINNNDSFSENNIYLDTFLNNKANCEIYLDNQIKDTSSQLLAFRTFFTDLEVGGHSYFVYCSNIENGTLSYDTSGVINFEILPPAPFTLTFNVIGNDFDVTKESLYIVTPCMEEGFSTIGTDKQPFRKEYNTGGIQFSKVKNGLATLTLNNTANEFCLFNGEVRYNTESVKSYDYDIVSVYKQVELGVIQTPNNVTNNYYRVPLDKFEIYPLTSPEAYGKKWDGTLVLGILMFLIGALIIFMGIRIPDGKVVMAGVFVLLIGTGFSIGGLVGILI